MRPQDARRRRRDAPAPVVAASVVARSGGLLLRACAEPRGVLDVNSGGAVFFCVFAPDPADSDPADRLERCRC